MLNKIGLPEKNSHFDIWGMMLNDTLSRLLHQDNYAVSVNAANPPSIDGGSEIYVYSTYTDTIESTAVTNNTLYPAGTVGLGYLGFSFVRETTAVSLSWGSTAFGVSSTLAPNSTYFLCCYGNSETYAQRFTGMYCMLTSSQVTPTWQEAKGGMYGTATVDSTSVDVKVLARFVSTGSTIKEVMQYCGNIKERGYFQNLGFDPSSCSLVVHQPAMDLDGHLVQYKQDVTLATSGAVALRWYGVCVNEVTGAMSLQDSTNVTDWNRSSNSLGLYTLYDENRKYNRCTIGSTYYRLIAVGQINPSTNSWNYIFPTPNRVKSRIECVSTASTSLVTGTNHILYSVKYDLLSEVSSTSSTRTSFLFKTGDLVSIDCACDVATSVAVTGGNGYLGLAGNVPGGWGRYVYNPVVSATTKASNIDMTLCCQLAPETSAVYYLVLYNPSSVTNVFARDPANDFINISAI